ncbi:MAG: UDP-2,3-diacylglucosamine diphosphatase LpxI, partial [Verrucomicrobiota bacterium]|nr:UDP-2,3-diacylglucosamine diphosphatase LpxI [Verrucomicrobiota bacterium]
MMPSPYPVRPVDSSSLQSLGIIAGSRELPLLIAREARRQGVARIVAVAFRDETSPEIDSVADEVEWLRVGQLSKLIKAFSSRDVRHCVMAGQIAPKNLFEFRPDLKTAAMLFRLKERNAHTIFGAIGDELSKGGVELIEATPWLGQAMPGPDFHLGPRLTAQQRNDIALGYRLAKEVSRLEIGQTVVVRAGLVLAVEAVEGTDAAIRRGAELSRGGAVVVKASKPGQDLRFDVPAVGPGTIALMAEVGASVLAV